MEFEKEKEFLGKTAIFSGAASGMGLAFARAWTELGGNACMCDIDEETLREKSRELGEAHPGRVHAAVCDVRDYAS
ncbi:MAG: SDR family NAD(P)-dependent oxidoreductase, partial [Clostridia bacterium]|nr:SDR family NAD(P)-dependent oxidoreductase [Clostridia bacterium]